MNFTTANLAEQLKGEAVGDGSVHRQAKRQWVGIQKLPDMIVRMRGLEKQEAALAARLG
jgi:hypothetical protein